MVTVLPEENPWGGIVNGAVSTGLREYMRRSDEGAVRDALKNLPVDSKPRDILNALTNVKTYGNESKQSALKNHMGVAELEDAQKKGQEAQRLAIEKLDLDKKSEERKAKQEAATLTANAAKTSKLESDRSRALDIREKAVSKKLGEDKIAEKRKVGEAGLKIVDEMEGLVKKGNLGIGTGVRSVFSGEARKDAARYSQLGKSLIPLASTIVIRNKAEFETLAAELYDPSLSDAYKEGILQSMKQIIKLNTGDLSEPGARDIPEGKVLVKKKGTDRKGYVTPYPGMEEKYDVVE